MGMDCRKIEQLIFPYLDGELTCGEAEAVRAHLSACADCGRKYEIMLQMSAALRHIDEIVIPAPAGFKDALMQRINNEAKPVAPIKRGAWLGRNWKQATAGIAAALLLIVGVASMNTDVGVQIAVNPPSVIQPDNSSPGVTPPANNTPATTTPIQTPDPSGTGTPAPSPNNPGDPVVTETPSPGVQTPRVLLNKDRALTTTLLQVKATDASAALQQALSLSNGAQAQTQNLGQQVNDNGSYTVLKITVPKSAAGGLIGKLSSLGTVTGQEVTKKDISSQFADKLSQYQMLISQRTTVLNANRDTTLDQRIKILENELCDWDQKAEQETIVLWLEK